MSKIIISEFDHEWAESFKKESAFLREIFVDNFAGLFHVGSTAVHGMAARPIVDILLVVNDITAASDSVAVLRENGYLVDESYEATGMFSLHKITESVTTHNLYITSSNDEETVKNTIGFVRMMRDDAQKAAEFADVKRRLAQVYADDEVAYTIGKAKWLCGEDPFADVPAPEAVPMAEETVQEAPIAAEMAENAEAVQETATEEAVSNANEEAQSESCDEAQSLPTAEEETQTETYFTPIVSTHSKQQYDAYPAQPQEQYQAPMTQAYSQPQQPQYETYSAQQNVAYQAHNTEYPPKQASSPQQNAYSGGDYAMYSQPNRGEFIPQQQNSYVPAQPNDYAAEQKSKKKKEKVRVEKPRKESRSEPKAPRKKEKKGSAVAICASLLGTLGFFGGMLFGNGLLGFGVGVSLGFVVGITVSVLFRG